MIILTKLRIQTHRKLKITQLLFKQYWFIFINETYKGQLDSYLQTNVSVPTHHYFECIHFCFCCGRLSFVSKV
jgi:hypothetical protein